MLRSHRLWLATTVILAAGPARAQFELTEISAQGSTQPLYLTKAMWQWEDVSSQYPGVTYNVYRKEPADDFRCLEMGLATPDWTGDPASPPPGTAWWYVVNGDDGCIENMHGSSIPIAAPCRTMPCPMGCRLTEVPGTALDLEPFAAGLSSPVYLTAPPGDVNRVFVVERGGDIEILDRDTGAPTGTFLDITPQIACCGEQGLLSMAFHPDYASNGRFFVNYTASGDGRTRVEEYLVSADPDVADPASARTLIEIPQFAPNHNGGQIAFGPSDGYLYIGTGDGGGSNDPLNAGQDPMTLLGKILRIDVDSASPYAIPADNPFVGLGTHQEEIWALGLRNPWRFSLDRATNDIYIGDVGQNCYEEVSAALFSAGGGENYGWRPLEADHCRAQPCGGSTLCAGCAAVASCADMTMPVVEIRQSDPPRSCSVIGGFVYRGCRMPDLVGRYFYSDNCGDYVRSFEWNGSIAANPIDYSGSMPEVNGPSSFGQDADGELYIVNLGGSIYRIIPQ